MGEITALFQMPTAGFDRAGRKVIKHGERRKEMEGKEKAWKGRRNKGPLNKFMTMVFVLKGIFPLVWGSVISLCF